MDNNTCVLPNSKKHFKSIKSKTSIKKNLGSLPNNIYPYLYIDQKFRNKSIIGPKIFKTALNSRKNSLLNSKNNSNSSTINNSQSKRSRFHSVNYLTSSVQINKNQKNNIEQNDNENFDIDKIEIKAQEDFRLPKALTKLMNKPNQNGKINNKKDPYLKTETNQKLIFNNVGIHYHRTKNNNKSDIEKIKTYNNKEISILKSQIKILIKKNEVLATEKTERDNKIEELEEKIDKLLNFIKEKKLSGAGEENNKLKNKINNLENRVNYLKCENDELKKEIEKKDKIILSLTNNQTESSPSHKKNGSIGKKKEKGDKNKINNVKRQNSNNLYNIDEDDIKKIKLISIDPDNF